MNPVSPHYRNDDIGELDTSIQAYLDEQYLPRVANLDKQNPKVVVVFSGGNAVGKTTLSRKIEKELGAVVIENDEIRRCLKEYLGTADANTLSPITWKYTNLLYSRLDEITQNGLVVRDGVIDWYYDRLMPIFEKNGYELFIIGYDLSDTKSRELIKQRGDTPTFKAERAYHLLDDHNIYIKRFREHYTPDIMLNDETVFDHDSVIEMLREKLAELKR
jgi:predicted kinase